MITFQGMGQMDGGQISIPANRISLGGLTVLVWHHSEDGNHIPQIISFFRGIEEAVVNIGPNGGSMHFIIGDLAGCFGDNRGSVRVDVNEVILTGKYGPNRSWKMGFVQDISLPAGFRMGVGKVVSSASDEHCAIVYEKPPEEYKELCANYSRGGNDIFYANNPSNTRDDVDEYYLAAWRRVGVVWESCSGGVSNSEYHRDGGVQYHSFTVDFVDSSGGKSSVFVQQSGSPPLWLPFSAWNDRSGFTL